MSFAVKGRKPGAASFRAKLLLAMMVVVLGITLPGLYLAQRNVAVETEHDLERDFQAALAALHSVQELRYAALAERCRTLVSRARIHAALEDNALDLLYPSAKDELRDLMSGATEEFADRKAQIPRARFYRFLDRSGAVLPPPETKEVGELTPEEEAQLALSRVPDKQQIGYLLTKADSSDATIDEVIAMPIPSTETGELIAELVVGFKPVEVGSDHLTKGIRSGIWLNGRLLLPSLGEPAQRALGAEITRSIAARGAAESSLRSQVGGISHQVFYRRLNPDSVFPPAYEVCIYPLTDLLARQQRLRWQAAAVGGFLLLIGLLVSHLISARLSVPVEKLAVDSEKNRAQRERAEASLALTSEELQRSARFSADASHQLKTPVSVLRAGLETLLRRDDFPSDVYEELSNLLHQTHRLSGVIDDLLLLSRMEAGRLRIEFNPVNLSQLIGVWLEDLSALPDALDLDVQKDVPANLHVAGEERYITLIVQNLLENARKYNRPRGRIRLRVHEDGSWVYLCVGNTGRPIPPAIQKHIFDRFYRSGDAKVPGHGLGLNLARELARLHGGDLRLSRSDESWTEFEVRFRLAPQATTATLQEA